MSIGIDKGRSAGAALLSICVPTFNRPDEVLRQVAFLVKECQSLAGVEIIVRDNCSVRFPERELLAHRGSVPIRVFRNESNVGLVGNLLRLYADASGAYVWFVGDDDHLYSGIVGAVMAALAAQPDFVMINHRAVDVEGKVRMLSALPEGCDFDLLDVFDFSGTTMMFVSSCVYRRERLGEALPVGDTPDRLTAPLFWSLHAAARGRTWFIRQVMIDNVWGSTSWDDKRKFVFNKLVPQEIGRSYALGYGKARVLRSLLRYRVVMLRQRLFGALYWLLKHAGLR